MLNLAFIFHMHQPYYKNLLTNEAELPWVRLHGTKDYLDMVEILENYPVIHQTFNLVPSLIEQIEDYAQASVKDKFLELSSKPAKDLTQGDKNFLMENFFSINKDKVIATFPRYYDLYFKKQYAKEFSQQDYLDLQVLFNLAWIDPSYRQKFPSLRNIVNKARFFTEEDKQIVLSKQIDILKSIIPGYKKYASSGQIEVTISPYYHPILPLLYNTNTAKEANTKAHLPRIQFAYPSDAKAQVEEAVKFYQEKLGQPAIGMWPSEEAVSEHILPMLIESGIKWIVTDEAILFKSLKSKKRDTALIYQPHLLEREGGRLNIVFRDRNLSDLLGFVYHSWKTENAVDDFMKHLENIAASFKDQDILVVIAMDGENAWEYYSNDGHDFLNLLYKRLSESKSLKTTTIKDYLNTHPAKAKIKRLAAGSWIYGDFGKWIGNAYKIRAWEWLAEARSHLKTGDSALAWKQMQILEGSDWFWWYGDNQADFDRLFRMHLSNFYAMINNEPPGYLAQSLKP